jgi:uncharacterized membrane protein YdjX (TVP38/TMEM64 family)
MNTQHSKPSPTMIKLLSVILFFLVLYLLSYYLGLTEHFSLSKLQNVFEQNTTYSLIIFILFFVLGNFIQIPGLIFLAAAVLTLGKFDGGIITYIAASVSCLTSFVIIRFMGGSALRELNYGWAKNMFKQLDNHPLKSVFILRSIFQTQPILNYCLALSGVSFRNHLIATLIALPLPIFLYCYFFDFIAKSLGVN